VPPEHQPRQTHPDSGDRDSGVGSGKNGIGGGSSTNRDNDNLRRQWRSPSPLLSSWGSDVRCDDDNGGQKGGQGEGEASAR